MTLVLAWFFSRSTRIIGIFATTVLAMSALQPSEAADWPRFLGPDQTGISTETNLLFDWPETGPPVLWSYRTGPSYSTPVVSAGIAIVFHRVGDEEVVDALDAQTGKRRWRHAYATTYVDRYRYNGGPRASAAVSGDRVVTYGAEGRLICLRLKTGERIWERFINRELKVPQGFFGVATAPVLHGETILLNVGASHGRGIIAFDLRSGRTQWEATDDGASCSTPVVRELEGQPRAFFLTRAGLKVVDPSDGTVNFEFPFRSPKHESVNAASPIVVGNRIFLTAAYKVGAVVLEIKDGGMRTVWRDRDAMQSHWATAVFSDGYIYGVHGRHESEAEIRCLNFDSGELAWRSPRGLGRATLLMAQNHLIVLGERGDLALVVVSPQSYIEKKRIRGVMKYPAWSPPVLANGLLYLRDETQVMCLDLRR